MPHKNNNESEGRFGARRRAEQDYFRTAMMAMEKPIWTPDRDRARRELVNVMS